MKDKPIDMTEYKITRVSYYSGWDATRAATRGSLYAVDKLGRLMSGEINDVSNIRLFSVIYEFTHET
jgi:hypothetical protein